MTREDESWYEASPFAGGHLIFSKHNESPTLSQNNRGMKYPRRTSAYKYTTRYTLDFHYVQRLDKFIYNSNIHIYQALLFIIFFRLLEINFWGFWSGFPWRSNYPTKTFRGNWGTRNQTPQIKVRNTISSKRERLWGNLPHDVGIYWMKWNRKWTCPQGIKWNRNSVG